MKSLYSTSGIMKKYNLKSITGESLLQLPQELSQEQDHFLPFSPTCTAFCTNGVDKQSKINSDYSTPPMFFS
jgi:hypothetical protein